MLVNCDVKGLEIVTAAFLSQDKVLCDELRNGVDIHSMNQVAFNLPTRLIAKTLKFRLLYGGSAFSFAKDPDFTPVSSKVSYWEKAIEAYYSKYKGIKEWHAKLIQEVITTRKLVAPTGRTWVFEPTLRQGELDWPVTTIKNYPVQGTGADLVMIARISLMNRMKRNGMKSLLVSSVHDSIVADCPNDEWEAVAKLMLEVVKDVPNNFSRIFSCDFNLPLTAEVEYGKNMKELTSFP